MIPYFELPILRFWGMQIDAFGALVAVGFILALQLATRRAAKMNQDRLPFHDAALICIVCGFVGAHLFHVFAYEPAILWTKPWQIFFLWAGISSFGGFLGAGFALWYYFHVKRLPVLEYGDTVMFGLWPGWILGRLGCFTAHDHPGRLTKFFLAVQFPQGARHDLGFYEALLVMGITIVIYVLDRGRPPKARKPGFYFALSLVMYGLPRFFFDRLRAVDVPNADTRYWGWTPAQYLSLSLVLLGVFLFLRPKRV